MRVWRFEKQEQATILGPNMFAPPHRIANRLHPRFAGIPLQDTALSTSKSLNTGAFIRRKLLIEFQVEFKYIDSCFAKNS